MGADRVAEVLPPLLRAVRDAGHPVVWACDPMHGNGSSPSQRRQDPPLRRRDGRDAGFFDACNSRGRGRAACTSSSPATNVTECLGGAEEMLEQQLDTLRDDVRPAPQRPPVPRPGLPAGRADAAGRARGRPCNEHRHRRAGPDRGLDRSGGRAPAGTRSRRSTTIPTAGRAGLEAGAATWMADSLGEAVSTAELTFVCGPWQVFPAWSARRWSGRRPGRR